MRQHLARFALPVLLPAVALAGFVAGRRGPAVPPAEPAAAETGHAGGSAHEGEADPCADEHGHEAAAGAGTVTLTPDRVAAAGIETAPVAMAPVAAMLSLNGEVQPDGDRTAKVGSPVTGRLVSLRAKVGDRVRRGQVLAMVASRDVADAESACARARAEERAAADRLRTLRALAATGALTRKPLEEAQSELLAATAAVKQAAASLARSRSARELADSELERKRKLADTGAFRSRPVEDARGEVARATAELESAQAAVKARRSAYERSQRLLSAGVAARREVEAAEAELGEAQAQEKEARTHLEVARQTLAREDEIARQNIHTTGEVQAAQTALRQAEKDVVDREAELERAQGRLRIAQATRAREERIASENLLARREVQDAEAALARAGADRTAAENALRVLRVQGGPRSGNSVTIPITAPIDGVVTERAATPGQAVEASTDLFTLVGGESVWVWANVYEKDMPSVRTGQPTQVKCSVHPGHTWSGRVGYVGVVSDEKTRSTRVRVDLPNPGGDLRPGMFVTVSLQLRQQRSALALPVAAVQQMDGQYVVFVARKPGEFERRVVRVGARAGSVYEVTEGVRAGESVVVKSAFLLKSELMKDQLSEGCAD